MALGRLPPAHLAACGCTQIGQIWIGSAALVPKQDRRQNGGYLKSPAKSASGQGVCGGDMSPPNGTCETRNIKSGSEKGQSQPGTSSRRCRVRPSRTSTYDCAQVTCGEGGG